MRVIQKCRSSTSSVGMRQPTIPATGTNHSASCRKRLIPSGAKRIPRHYSGQPSLPNRYYRRTTTVIITLLRSDGRKRTKTLQLIAASNRNGSHYWLGYRLGHRLAFGRWWGISPSLLVGYSHAPVLEGEQANVFC